LGWLLHDVEHRPVEALPINLANKPQVVVPPDIHDLFEQDRLQEVVELSGGDTRLISLLIGDSTTLRSGQLWQMMLDAYGDSFFILTKLAIVEKTNNEFESALSLMSRADLLAKSVSEQQMVSRLLNEITDAYAKVLLSTENFQAVDDLYERMTYAMPEQAQYYLKLGQLRIRLGNYDRALAPLSQIENHMEFGAQARELVAQTEVNEVVGSLEVVPLKGSGNHFVVEAVLNEQTRVNLLVDTGAAMTILDQRVLREMGYNLNGNKPVLFSTANGVVEAPVVSIDQLKLGGASIGPLSVGALPLSMKNGIDGLLGMNFLKRYDFRIDQDRRELHLNSER
jgi:clan AA aspartic protease (TIGR02281 family)